MKDLQKFITDRNVSLASLDEDIIKAFMRKYEIPYSDNERIFWASIHKSITACTGLPKDLRSRSKAWLLQYGLTSMDDGDL